MKHFKLRSVKLFEFMKVNQDEIEKYQYFFHVCVFFVIFLNFTTYILIFQKEKHSACYESGESSI